MKKLSLVEQGVVICVVLCAVAFIMLPLVASLGVSWWETFFYIDIAIMMLSMSAAFYLADKV